MDSTGKEAWIGYRLDKISFVTSWCILWFRLVDSVFHGCTGIFYIFSILRDMIRFLRKFLCVSCIFLLLSGFSMFIMMHSIGSWNEIVLVDLKKQARIASLSGKKICFVGGSNLSYGLDSYRVQEHFGLPVANLGLHAGFGMNYMLYEVNLYVNTGDVVVLVPEYNQFINYYGSSALADLFIQTKQWKNFPIYKEWTTYPSYFCSKVFTPSLLKRKVVDEYADNPNGFNEFGDYILHLDQPKRMFPCLPLSERPKVDQIHTFANEVRKLRERGVHVIILPPSYALTSFNMSKSYIDEITSTLEGDSVPFVVSPSRYAFTDTLFWNTAYHLSAEGRRLRTDLVIADLDSIGIN